MIKLTEGDLVIDTDSGGDKTFWIIPTEIVGDTFEVEDWMDYIGENYLDLHQFGTALEAFRFSEDTGVRLVDEHHFNTY